MSKFDYTKIDNINSKIDDLHSDNLKIEQTVDSLNNRISKIDQDILNIRNRKDIIKEYYYEKIKGVDSLSTSELDSFFTERYGK